MERPEHIFKIGEQIYRYAGGMPRRNRTRPYTVVDVVRQSTALFCIGSRVQAANNGASERTEVGADGRTEKAPTTSAAGAS